MEDILEDLMITDREKVIDYLMDTYGQAILQCLLFACYPVGLQCGNDTRLFTHHVDVTPIH